MRQPGILVMAPAAARRSALQELLRVFWPPEKVYLASAFSLARLQQCAAEVVLADLESSVDATSLLTFLSSVPFPIATVALIDDPDPAWVRRALAADVNAIIARDAAAEDLRLATEAADAGLVLLHPTSARLLIPSAAFPLEPDRDYSELERLTPREQEVLRLMSAGLGNREIAVQLGISEHTVKFHASSILGKLGASSRTEAVSHGIRRGLISL